VILGKPTSGKHGKNDELPAAFLLAQIFKS
jgi:hypothetical protein